MALDVWAGELFAEAALHCLAQWHYAPGAITALGSHGQTLLHNPFPPYPYTTQIGDPNVIAQRTGIVSVADFRRRDIAAGGQGAPLAPALHNQVFRSQTEYRAVLNLGGIANLTLLPAEPSLPVIGFDTGPGNGLLDAWIQQQRGLSYDANGDWARQGTVIAEALARLSQDTYFDLPTPKSTGRDYFNLAWLRTKIDVAAYQAEDIQATLLELSIQSITQALRHYPVERLLVCGGGVHNTAMMTGLAKRLGYPVESTAAYGIEPDWVEAVCFAWLAKQRLDNVPGNLPSVTGARQAVTLGAVYSA